MAPAACAGATTTEAYPELKKRGYVAVVSLRRDTEPGADIPGAKAAAAAGDEGKPQTGGEGAPKRTGWENYDEKCGQCCADAGGSWDAGDRRHCCVGADYDEEIPSCRVTWVDKGGRSHDCTYRMGCRRPD